MTSIKKIALPLSVGFFIALISNAVTLEIILDIINSEQSPSANIKTYIGRLSISVLLTLWVSVMVALYIGRDKERQANERNKKERQLLYINKETQLPNAPWLDYVFEVKKNPLNEKPLEIKSLQVHVVLWWQKITNYLGDMEKDALIAFVKNQSFPETSKNSQLGYLGNGIFYTFANENDSFPKSLEYAEYQWGAYTIAISQTEVSCTQGYNSYQLVSLARALAQNVEEGADYFENLGAVAKSRATLMPEAWDAISANRVDFAFQPIFNMCSGDVCGFEMLARLKSENGGTLPINAEVAELFENSPLSLRFHRQLLSNLLLFQSKLNAISTGIIVSVNVPAPILIRPSMLRVIYRCVENGLNLKQVGFELTERSLPARSKAIKEGLYRLIGLGAKIHLDDFGAGQSSIETISAYDFDLIKLDRQFINSDTWTHEKAEALIKYLKSLGTEVLAEGIEDEDLADLFAKAGAHYVQGFAFAQPMTEAEALEYIRIK
jgi:EAL domain-containing protein (putative c-di-GMP-specific phosphodiesterase class I)/RNase P protein component